MMGCSGMLWTWWDIVGCEGVRWDVVRHGEMWWDTVGTWLLPSHFSGLQLETILIKNDRANHKIMRQMCLVPPCLSRHYHLPAARIRAVRPRNSLDTQPPHPHKHQNSYAETGNQASEWCLGSRDCSTGDKRLRHYLNASSELNTDIYVSACSCLLLRVSCSGFLPIKRSFWHGEM